jgi:signal transduction histidine kinase
VDVGISDRVVRGSETFLVVIRDYGQGIDSIVLPRIFDPFFTTGRGRGGTGLGLAIVKSIVVSIMKGSIEVQSEPGQGTSFFMTFPKCLAD